MYIHKSPLKYGCLSADACWIDSRYSAKVVFVGMAELAKKSIKTHHLQASIMKKASIMKNGAKGHEHSPPLGRSLSDAQNLSTIIAEIFQQEEVVSQMEVRDNGRTFYV